MNFDLRSLNLQYGSGLTINLILGRAGSRHIVWTVEEEREEGTNGNNHVTKPKGLLRKNSGFHAIATVDGIQEWLYIRCFLVINLKWKKCLSSRARPDDFRPSLSLTSSPTICVLSLPRLCTDTRITQNKHRKKTPVLETLPFEFTKRTKNHD